MKLARTILFVNLLAGTGASPLHEAAAVVAGRETTLSQTQLDNFQYFAQYSVASYCSNENDGVPGPISCINDVCPALGVAKAVTILGFDTGSSSSPDLFGFVALDPTRSFILVVFRGSYSVRNWIANLEVDLVDTPICNSCKVHNGFNQAFLERQAAVLDSVKSARATNPSYSLVIVGHSLGGAVATITGAYLRSVGLDCDIYTYGSPRVGNEAFANYASSASQGSIFRITHLNDPVPHLPSGGNIAWLTQYYHTTPEYWLSDGSYWTIDYDINNIQICTGTNPEGCAESVPIWDCDVLSHAFYFEDIISCDPAFTYR